MTSLERCAWVLGLTVSLGCPSEPTPGTTSPGDGTGTDAMTDDGVDESSGGDGEDGVEALPHRSCVEDEGIILPLPPGSEAYAAAGFDR